MAIQTINATIQMRHGLERDFQSDKMTAGEWAVSTDNKYVRMCFAPGLVLRMATYESFEADVEEIRVMLEECRDIQTAVDRMAALAQQHRDDAQAYAQAAEASKDAAKISEDAAKASEDASKASEDAAAVSAQAAETAKLTAEAYKTTALEAKDAAELSAQAAETAKTYAEEHKQDALASKEAAAVSAQAAFGSAGQSADSALLSESFAHGQTGVRQGEGMDNSEYYCRKSQEIFDSIESAGSSAIETLGNALNLAKPQFLYNPLDGHLYCKGGRFEFALDDNKHLRWRLAL